MTAIMLAWLLAGAAVGALLAGLWLRAQHGAARAAAAEREAARGREIEELRGRRLPALEEQLRERDAAIGALRGELEHARVELSALRERNEQERHAAAQQLVLLEQAKSALGDAFKALSSDALTRNNQTFLELARAALAQHEEKAKGELEARTKEIDSLVKPLKESLDKVDTRIGELEKVRASAYGTLTEQIRSLATTQVQLQSETANLVKALRAPAVRGRWGELQLRRVVELAGMVAYCDFVEQESINTTDGRLRPDMVVRLPNDRRIVVDSKAPLDAYLTAIETQDDAVRMQSMNRHAQQIRTHIQKLSARNYWDQFDATPEFVVLFLPGETFFSAALEHDPGLIEAGVEQRVLLATPTTLIALMKAVAYGWRQEQLTKNAQEISRLGKDLYDRMRVLANHFAEIRRNLDRTVASYNKAVGSIERSVLPAARRFRDLGAGTGDDIVTLEAIDHATRETQAAELAAGSEAELELAAVVEPAPPRTLPAAAIPAPPPELPLEDA